MSALCERCAYDDVDLNVDVPDFFQDRYLELCAQCAKELHAKQAKMEDYQ